MPSLAPVDQQGLKKTPGTAHAKVMKQESEGSGEQFGKFPFLLLRPGQDFPQI